VAYVKARGVAACAPYGTGGAQKLDQKSYSYAKKARGGEGERAKKTQERESGEPRGIRRSIKPTFETTVNEPIERGKKKYRKNEPQRGAEK